MRSNLYFINKKVSINILFLIPFTILLFIFTFTSSKNVYSRDWRENHYGAFLSSQIARANMDIENSAYFSKMVFDKNEDSPALAIMAIEALASNGQIGDAIKITNNMKNIDSIALALYLKSIHHLNEGNYEALKLSLTKVSPNGIDSYIIPILQAWASAGLRNHEESIRHLNNQADKGILSPIYDYHLALINDWVGEYTSAKQKYEDAITRSNTPNAKLFISASSFFERRQLYELRDLVDKKFEKTMPDSSELLIFETKKNKFNPSRPLVTNIREGIAETFLNTSEILYNEGLVTQALIYSQIAFFLNRDLDNAKLILGNIFKANQNYDRAIKYYKSIKDDSYLSIKSKIAIAKCLSEMQKSHEAISSLEYSGDQYKDNYNYLKTIAEIYYDIKDFKNSTQYYEKIFSKIPKMEERHWPLLYASGIALERDNRWEQAEEKFKQALAFSPDQPLILNYLAYSWIDQGRKLDLAMTMIKKALEGRPNDGYIVDSLGWAYYQVGEYHSAVENLEKAVELVSGDAIIIDHLGDALFYSGRKIEAKFQWKRALEFDPQEDLILQLNNKIKGLSIPKPGVKAPSSKNM